VKATLIVVPPVGSLISHLIPPLVHVLTSRYQHLTSQWPSEVAKFTKGSPNGGLKVITVKDIGDLKRKSIADFQEADIVIVSDSVFKSQLYWPQM
jgi:hypothetical protein